MKYTTGKFKLRPKGKGAQEKAPTSNIMVTVAFLPRRSYKIPPNKRTKIEPKEAYVIEFVLIYAAF